ncbi:glycoprotease family-domain-containing protein [Tribonema minus]|uniref:N(6)-L-threonylcarbamoyladenine synthase n=1 Tax=Tribonema minus TaxID=303371 RepID=A0A835YKI5_9STRA|nr:glycoprotease family-domain-containing protein [Tribonema minus]
MEEDVGEDPEMPFGGDGPFTVLGIETSCDDTGAAVVRSDGTILGEALASQQDIHEKWGGVVPGLAREAHVNEIDRIVAAALAQAGMASAAQVDAVAVTVGPGLEICLRVGCEKAKALALEHAKPFVAVHHLEAHVMLARAGLGAEEGLAPPAFPFLALLVSGGHCQLLLCEGVGRFSILGGTVDDALGEAFDKVARLLGLPTGGGGGPAVERCARAGDPRAYPLPIPMVHKKDMNFSYAGLKNSFRMTVERARAELALSADAPLPDGAVADLAASFQHAAITHLEQRVRRAVAHCHARGVRTLAVVGGVAANAQVRARLGALCAAAGERDGEGGGAWRMVVPPARLCTDNGVMVAWSAVERLRCGVSNAAAGQEVYARVPLGPQIAAEASGSGGGGSSPK